MKRLSPCLLVFILLFAPIANAADIFVSPKGSDTNNGSRERPFATLTAALRKARELRRVNDESTKSGINIILSDGIYQTLETIVLYPEDAGTNDSPTYIKAAPGAKPVLSGGVQITGWERLKTAMSAVPVNARDKIWVADVPSINGWSFEFRQLWVNEIKAVRAKSANGDQMHRILNWNKQEQTCIIPTLSIPPLKNATGVELFIHQWWEIAILRIRKMQVLGDSTKLFFHQPESKIQSEHPWPAPWISKETGNSAFYLTNAIQFLDEPGEWFLDIHQKRIYYYPRLGENMQQVAIIAPYTETLMRLEGTANTPVTNIIVDGVSFQHSGWLRPSQKGHVPHQAGMYMTEAYRLRPVGTKEKPTLDNQAWVGRPAAAVEISFATKVNFLNCNFRHMASTGIDLRKGAKNNVLKGNIFKDIGGNGILAGVYSDEANEIHLTYRPNDEREICDSILISNNLVTDAANEDWGCLGIGAGYVRNTKIEHNEVENVSYTGISMGWGWNARENVMRNNRIRANRIHHYGKHNYDCAGIYTLSAQPGTVISENYVDSIYKAPYAHLPSHWFYLYTDEGSSGITIRDNWSPSEKFLQNANGPGNEWSNNGPNVDELIKRNAGLQPEFSGLAKEKSSRFVNQGIASEHHEVIELVVKEGKSLDLSKLKLLLHKNSIDSASVYHWQNHYVIFAKVQDVGVMQGRIQNNFPDTEVKVYHDMFYEYSKMKQCSDIGVATEWEHILLTANLVTDKRKQQEYLDYHATQFEKWPDVSKGFCNANFQQLLLFRNGRQLLLVISIPKGESLDQLNPRSTANNPRMMEWNRIMGKYQEGIEGTKKGETWVFLKRL
ncbi:MAG: right-handed parallel beta-helix repeat-containing protein [Chitinophagaceae bacterium]|nr:right-handed parallel beta-helix repeat-containing protein [Chitinophagaceae bacterium]